MFHGVEKFFRPGYQAHLTASWLPALEGVVAKLEAGAKVADIGCGHGASTIVMAKAYPKSRFFGFDFHAPSVEIAGKRAADAGVGSRVTFARATAKDYAEREFDLICFFDCLHDMGDPVGAARSRPAGPRWTTARCCSSSRSQGTALPRTRTRWGACSMRRRPWCARRTRSPRRSAWAWAPRRESAGCARCSPTAGFSRFRRATETPFNLILEARK